MNLDMLKSFYIIPSRNQMINIICTDNEILETFKKVYNDQMRRSKILDETKLIQYEKEIDIIE